MNMLPTIAAMSTMHPINSSSRYLIGIDLGTTNSAVSYFDTEKPHQIHHFYIPQQGRHEHEESLPLLPSFLYINTTQPNSEPDYRVGTWAKIEGSKVPTRLIHSAKSWLSHSAAHRKERILPVECVEGDKRLSPIEASARYLIHIREMWNRHMGKGGSHNEFEEQEIILTIPASFDEVARSLTLQAAEMAGIKKITLIEEPQAAFYNWLMEQGESHFSCGDTILICDVGGGTTDFTLIDVTSNKGAIELSRTAVGKHLLLGGDNMDMALAHLLERDHHLSLDGIQYLSLVHQVREAKEVLINAPLDQVFRVYIPGKGSQLVGGGVALEITAAQIKEVLVEGFFALLPFEEASQMSKAAALLQMGLPYEKEPSITKHLASFLKMHHAKKPTHLLFNGGALKPKIFQERIIQSLHTWFGADLPLSILNTVNFDHAVARGAAYFGKIRLEEKKLIRGGIPRSFYLEIELDHGKRQGLTLVPRGTNEGIRLLCTQTLRLIPNRPVFFQLYHSNTRLNDHLGDFVPITEEEMTPLPLMHTQCNYGKKGECEPLPVSLEVYLTAIGTLEIALLSAKTTHRWKLEFQLRGEGQREDLSKTRLKDETYDFEQISEVKTEIVNAFSPGLQAKLGALMPTLEKLVGSHRREWSPSLLRELFESTLSQSDKRFLSPLYESKLWNLTGFFLRPGVGYPLDDERIKNMWKLILADAKKPKTEEVQIQLWICCRRIAAGLGKGQQIQLFNDLHSQKQKKGGYAYAEHLRALSALELVDSTSKIKLGEILLTKIISGKGEPCDYWALGRLGARQLLYGGVANVLPQTVCERWIHALIESPLAKNDHLPFTLAMLARKTELRSLDISEALLKRLAPFVESSPELESLLWQERSLTQSEQERFFGDSLPCGLIL